MLHELRQWRHVFKLDPDKPLSEEALEKICLSGTDAIIVGGSSGVTFDNTVELLARIRCFAVPCVLEVSSEEALVPGFDGYLIPVVLNASDSMWITGLHHKAIRDYGALMNWREIVAEGYVIVNPSSTAAVVTGALPIADGKDLIAYARMADKLFRMPVFYVEYSGMFGNMEWLREVARVLEEARLFYGGGIDGADKARQALEAGAHTIVVGNILYEDLEAALSTVEAAKTQFIG